MQCQDYREWGQPALLSPFSLYGSVINLLGLFISDLWHSRKVYLCMDGSLEELRSNQHGVGQKHPRIMARELCLLVQYHNILVTDHASTLTGQHYVPQRWRSFLFWNCIFISWLLWPLVSFSENEDNISTL